MSADAKAGPPAGTAGDAPMRAHYEAYPYPARDAADEAKRLIAGSPGDLIEIDHYLYAGRRDFGAPFRALVAGGGTGDATVMLAQRLANRGPRGEVVYADPSAAARRIAAARVAARGLANVRFLTARIEDLPGLGLGRFDYIDCCGVLHHLAEPERALAMLTGLLAPAGGIGLMVYGALGRTGVYPAQALLRLLGGDKAMEDRVAMARSVLDALPATNWLKRNPFVRDWRVGGDAGLYDLLLHSRDRAYLVPEVIALAQAAGLRVVAFVDPALYDPATYLGGAKLKPLLDGLGAEERWSAAELAAGNLAKHVCYLVRAENAADTIARPGPLMVPQAREIDLADLAAKLPPGRDFTLTVEGNPLAFPMPPLAAAILRRIDGTRTLAASHADLTIANPNLDWNGFAAQYGLLHAALNGLGKLFLRAGG